MNNKFKTWFYGIGAAVVIGGLFAWPIITDPNRPLVKAWNDAGIDCLSSHQNASQHIHQSLTITVDGINEIITANTGIVSGCMAELHVHEGEAGVIHLETVLPDKEFKLKDFFIVHGAPLIREGYTLEAKVNGEVVADPAELILADKQQITLDYSVIKP